MDHELYPGADYRPTRVSTGTRTETWGITEHETYGASAADYIAGKSSAGGDESVFLNTYPVHFYVMRSGGVRQYARLSQITFHAFDPANELAVSIEHEGRNDVPWTAPQLAASAKLNAWLLDLYGLPTRHAAHPRLGDRASWAGMMSHHDLTLAGIGGPQQNHTDTIPAGLGWDGFLAAVAKARTPAPAPAPASAWPPPYGDTLRLVLPAHAQSPWAGWGACRGPLEWIAVHGLAVDTTAVLTWRGTRYDGATAVERQARALVREYLTT